MAKILILGGYGYVGKLAARHLLEQSDADIVIAGRSVEKARTYADTLNAEFKAGRVSILRTDAADRQNLRQSLQGVDLLLVAAPTTRHAENVIRAALDSGVDYLDVQLGAQKLALLKSLASDMERSGRCFITEAGYHPGLPSAMVRYAASQLDRIDTAITTGYLNMGRALPFSEAVDELMEFFRHYNGQLFKDGSWTKAGSYDIRTVNFGGEIGTRQCFSMYLEELRGLPEQYPSLRETGFYISGTHWIVDWVISPIAMACLKIAPRHAVRPIGRLLWWGMQTFPKPPYLVLLKVEATGEKDGKSVMIEAAVSHPDGYELTAIPVTACLLQYLDGSVRHPGLWMMGHLIDPVRLLKDMERMGVQVTANVTPLP